MQLSDLTFGEVTAYLKKSKAIILPSGSIEQHSLALPLGTDTFIAQIIAERIAERKHLLVGPAINIGFSGPPQPFLSFPGTLSYRRSTIKDVVIDYLSSLYLHGFRKFYIINAHGGNNSLIRAAVKKTVRNLSGGSFYLHNWWKIDKLVTYAHKYGMDSLGHAGGLEASLALYLFNSKVKPGKFVSEHSYTKTKSGVIDSDQTIATAAIGKEAIDIIVKNSLTLGKSFERLK